MQRLSDDRGAVAIVVALLMVPLVGFAAIAIDVSAVTAQRQQMQTGADAGALAIAQDCAHNACGNAPQTAQTLETANLRDGQAAASVTYPAAGQVTVVDTGVRKHRFAAVLGITQSTIRVSASAGWGNPSGGTMVLPLAFSWCEFLAQTGGGMPSGSTQRTILFTKSSGIATCTGPSNNVVPGGFGWLTVNSGSCNTSSSINDILSTSTGVAVPSGCSVSNFAAVQGQTVLLPIFDQAGDTGSNSWYHVYGYAAFTITGYYFGGQYSWNPGTCKGTIRCIIGYFTQFLDQSDAFAYSTGAPQFGATVVSLTK